MSEDKGAGASFGNVGVLLVAAIAYITATHTQLLHDTRPVSSEAGHSTVEPAEIEARLWQDPFQVVVERLKREHDHSLPRLDDMDLKDSLPGTKIIEVMVPGGPYEELSEIRRRRRYGVLTALRAADYVPVRSGQLNVARLKQAENCTLRDQRGCVAWEEFLVSPQAVQNRPGLAPAITVVWLREDAALVTKDETTADNKKQGAKPFAELRKISASMLPNWHDRAVTVLGPGSSDTLVRMFAECSATTAAGRDSADACPAPDDSNPALHLLDFGATKELPDAGEEFRLWHDRLPDCVDDIRGNCFRRFGASDDLLVKALMQELNRRGMSRRPMRVVLLSEWDSAYGQGLRSRMNAELSNAKPSPKVFDYGFYRGLDGKLPSDPGAEQAGSSDTARVASRQKELPRTDVKAAADTDADGVAEGQSQIDYIRRLGDVLKTGAQGQNIDAIGIFGSDVYDKLLITQELRPLFPYAMLFTTDLDARLLARDVRASTHNLIVASGFDLKLPASPLLEDFRASPFRDNYETGAFVTALYALQCEFVQAQISPLCKTLVETFSSGQSSMFELGASGKVIDLAGPASQDPDILFQRLVSAPFWIAFLSCLAAVCASALISAAAANADLRSFLMTGPNTSRSWRVIARACSAAVALCFIGLLAAPLLEVWLSQSGDGQVVGWADGTSLWPSIALLLADSALAVWFIVLVVIVLHANTVELATKFKLDDAQEVWALLLRRRLSFEDFRLRRPVLPFRTDSNTLDIKAYWRNAYLFRCATISRFARGVLVSALTSVPIGFVAWALPGPPLLARGELVRVCFVLSSSLCCGCMLLLASLVFDATMNSERFVRYIRSAPSHWPDMTIDKYAAKLGFSEPCLADWIDIQFTRLRTRVILRLTYFPFIVIAVLIVARGIADRTLLSNLVVIVAVVLAVLMLIASVVALRAEAEGQRRAMIKRLKEAASRAAREASLNSPASTCSATSLQLDLLIERAQSLRDGAFSAVLNQPILKAFVLPVLGYIGPWLVGALPG